MQGQMIKDKNATAYSSHNKMIWSEYAGLLIVGIGCLVLMVGLIEYLDHLRNVAENFSYGWPESCKSLSSYNEDNCRPGMLRALIFLSHVQADIFRIIILGAIVIGSGMALFIISHKRPAWFRRISAETAK